MAWNANMPEGHESFEIKYDIVPYTRGRVLDLGSGPWKTFPHFISWDNYSEWDNYNWRPDIIGDAQKLDIIGSKSLDAVFSSHLLEHIDKHISALKEWWRVIKIGGYLVLYLPHKDLYPNIGEKGANVNHKHDFLPKDIISILKENCTNWDLVESFVKNGENEYSFLQVFQKLPPGSGQNYTYAEKRPLKTCGVVRYGGIGDMLQTSSVAAKLKKEGYAVYLHTTPQGKEILEFDKNIDKFILQDTDQVPNHELRDFWDCLSKKYDKFVNLSESVEGSWLALEGRTKHFWPQKVKHKYMNANYIEFAYDLAGLSGMPPEPIIFYPSKREEKRAKITYDKIAGEHGLVVTWALSGSSLHKTWPYVDSVIARFMLETRNINFVLVGDDYCRILEAGWEKEPRVHLRSGEWSIRETLAFAQISDLVIGPETSLLQLDTVKRVILLSHSSPENLTKYWKNAFVLTPEDCECYPCHMMHHGYDFCNSVDVKMHDGKAKAAKCKANISPDRVINAIIDALGIKKPDRELNAA